MDKSEYKELHCFCGKELDADAFSLCASGDGLVYDGNIGMIKCSGCNQHLTVLASVPENNKLPIDYAIEKHCG